MKTTDPHTPSSPEALEALLAQKAFVELTDAERAYALEHLESEEEYASMRALLLSIEAAPAETIAPRPGTKEALMDLFPTEERGGFRVWLNNTWALLLRPQEPWFRQPAFGVAFAAVLAVVAGVFLFQGDTAEEAFAEHRTEAPAEVQPPASSGAEEDQTLQEASTEEGHNTESSLNEQEEVTNQLEADQEVAPLPPPPAMEDVPAEQDLEWTAVAEEEAPEEDMVLDLVFDADVDDADFGETIADAPATGNSTNAAATPSVGTANALRTEAAEGEELAVTKSFSTPATTLDTQAVYYNASPVDEAHFNTYTAPEITLDHFEQHERVETLSGVTISSTDGTTTSTTGSRGLDITFSPGENVVLGESAVQYSSLFDLMQTEW